ncbi:MAG: hypothetical protein Cons2KO_09630 [Congregibacter sp.]
MADDLNINLSYSSTLDSSGPQSGPTPGSGAVDADLVAFVDLESVPINNQMSLMINRRTGAQQLIAPQVEEALRSCTRLYSLAEHTSRLCSQRPELKGQEAVVNRSLKQLIDAGYGLSGTECKTRFSDIQERPLASSVVCILTCDRPDAVERLLESMLHVSKVSRHAALYLIDDSRDAENQRRNASLVEEFNLRCAKSMSYFGQAEQRDLLEQLLSKLPEHREGIEFLIDAEKWRLEKSYGRSRTLALLLSIDSRLVMLDDDVLCQAVAPMEAAAGIGVETSRRVGFFESADDLMQNAQTLPFDPISGHLQFLGQAVGSAVGKISEVNASGFELRGVDAALLNTIDPAASLVSTQSGSWGNTGTTSPHWALNLDESSIERLVNASIGMKDALERHHHWAGASQFTLRKSAFLSQVTGLDNQQLLPPYFPAFRGEDLLFGATTEFLHPRCGSLEYPWAVPHLPTDGRSGLSLRTPIALTGGMGTFSRILLASVNPIDSRTPESRLQELATVTDAFADKRAKDLLVDYRLDLARTHVSQLNQYLTIREKSEQLPSANWQAYTKRAVEEVQQALENTHAIQDISSRLGNQSDDEIISQFRALARGWASALRAWPAMREASR